MTWRSIRQTEKGCDCPVKPDDVFVIKTADAVTEPVLPDCENFVDHNTGRKLKAIQLRRFDEDTKEREISWVFGEAANGHGVQHIKMCVLNDDDGTRFLRMLRVVGSCPNLAALQSAFQSDMESTHAWSSAANGLALARRD
jgi:hypothetical protein